MNDQVLRFAVQHGRIAIFLAMVTLFLLLGATGEVFAHGPCHNNPGNVPDMVCADLPSQDAPRG